MYHPAPGLDVNGQAVDGDEYEFFELKNAGTNTLNLGGMQFTAGITFVFINGTRLAPGQFFVLARNPARFTERYPGVAINGVYAGKLDNDGETLRLAHVLGTPAVSVTYDAVRYNDKAPWPTAADGRGPSLQRRSDDAYGNDPASWLAAFPTPGRSQAGGTAPALDTQPVNVRVFPGDEAAFHVVATGDDPLFYQWHCNGTPIAGATNATLTLTNLQPAQSGRYAVVVFNESGTAESTPAVLTVVVVANIVTQPKDVTVRLWPDPQAAPTTNVTFSVLASGSAALNYQWRFNGSDVPGATGTSLTLTNVQTTDAGDYDVVISSAVGTVVSATAHLYPVVTPVFTQPALSQTIVAGGTVTLSVAFAGNPPPFTNEWRVGSTLVETHILNDPLNFLTLTVPNVATTMYYRAFLKNVASSGNVISPFAILTVLADANTNGLPDVWEAAFGIDDPDADNDSDGVKNWQEYQAGTNPTNAASFLKLSIEPGPDSLRLQFDAVPYHTYSVQYQEVLGSGAWETLSDFVGRSSNRVETITIPLDPANSRFYRMTTPKRP